MNYKPTFGDLPTAQRLAEQAANTLHRFLHVEAVSGLALLVAAAAALFWANSTAAHSYHVFWNLPFAIGLGEHVFSQSLHFWVNDVLMTAFFLVVGMEIRREVHEGALSRLDQAVLPLVAAAGGVLVPALIYLSLNNDPARGHGWAVPTATDIAFAVGVLALLGRKIPVNVRVFLLALAIIDDIIAVLIIAVFYTESLQWGGFVIAASGILGVLAFQRVGIGAALPYLVPGLLIWGGFFIAGVHPTLAGVVLGLMTPARPLAMREPPLDVASRALGQLKTSDAMKEGDPHSLQQALRDLHVARREILPPVSRVQMALHTWVAYGVMPIFALANAGVSITGTDDLPAASLLVMMGTALALIAGKPLGVIGATWIAVRSGFCRLAPGVSWGGVLLVGLLAGIGFTMSIFISMLAFSNEDLLRAAKLGVLLGSVIAATLGLGWGAFYVRRQ
ncbi:sodium/proton antiporter, NhaA family [Bradyrhizobium sp. Rc3b]|uniref:Na+/H+ antiporter NhaA n=1 Tax=Bradyrhizobium sp. Rc3b TaxID=1855322 RepID=UPI0008EF6385|nr:Na+/H+ antiporter NhaA [Bradyrhizobium sp. Rc3b]SFN17735.1 sodium/proton antiporter, NhaA family [Bradyrhizobium sp. Rc3b]